MRRLLVGIVMLTLYMSYNTPSAQVVAGPGRLHNTMILEYDPFFLGRLGREHEIW